MEDGGVNHSWFIGVVSQSYGGLGGGRDEGDGLYVCRTKPEWDGHMSRDAGALPAYKVKTPMTPDHTTFQVRCSGYGLVGLEGRP